MIHMLQTEKVYYGKQKVTSISIFLIIQEFGFAIQVDGVCLEAII